MQLTEQNKQDLQQALTYLCTELDIEAKLIFRIVCPQNPKGRGDSD